MYKKHITPWQGENKSSFLFPISEYDQLLKYLNIYKKTFQEEWLNNSDLSNQITGVSSLTQDWLWCIYLPILSQIKVFINSESKPLIIGLSGLPGCGKSTFGKNLEDLARLIDIKLNVISMDDFYLPGSRLDLAMRNNPWNVPRGLPGSHSVIEITESLQRYIDSGILIAPQFDKSLRNGSGDRSGKLISRPEIIVLEGWFLGCQPARKFEGFDSRLEKELKPLLSKEEINYRYKVQTELKSYSKVWEQLSFIWHIKAKNYSFTNKWKSEQEQKLFLSKGSSLRGDKLSSFIRMINSSIPQYNLQNIKSNVALTINQNRRIIKISTASK